MTEPAGNDALRKQYEFVLQEYRFQVQLNWDRSKHYLTFNTTILGAAVALSKGADTWAAQLGIFALLLVAALNSYAGAKATSIGHGYYQRIRNTKSALEKVLQLEVYSIQSTPGMMRDHDTMAEGIPPRGAHRFGNIVRQTRALLTVLALLSGAGAVTAFVVAVRTFLKY